MEPISVALLAALAGGAGGEAGRQAWAALSELVRRPFRRDGDRDGDGDGDGNTGAPAAGSAEPELVRLAAAPDDATLARALSTALAVRAARDADFQAGLRRWHELAGTLHADEVHTGDVHSEITGGTFAGPVLQGRDFSGLSFTTPAPPRVDPDTDTPPTPD
ncbi:hypothetical protein G9272_38775 [Streptomyces asoensis]|uniref:Uncharacterized protein n=1 Tax=Streptomyces asoensis TaxID=249586 RepID=A0A6M4X024_9ACTN|nr:hypothetical protein G9272_38775 [Streptomyces asoensis]